MNDPFPPPPGPSREAADLEADAAEMPDAADIRRALARTPGWDEATAHERAKRCCALLTRAGQRLPSWMALRELIGKGSAGDINRAKGDFRREHGAALRKMDGAVDGVPVELAPHIAGFWMAAIAQAREGFEGQVAQWQAHVEHSDSRAEQAEADRALALDQAKVLQARLEGVQQALEGERQRADGERAAREQAERMFEGQAAESAAQRERLEVTLKESKVEMGQLVERFEGERHYSLMRIEEARTQAAGEIAAARDGARRERAALEIDVARLDRAVAGEREKSAAAERAASRLADEAADLRQRLARAEAENRALSDRHARERPSRPGPPGVRPPVKKLRLGSGSRPLRGRSGA